jgi:hypothetical protein
MSETAHDTQAPERGAESYDETGLWNTAEKSWFVYVGIGIAIGVVFWTIGVLPGLFGGVFAGGAAGAMVHEFRHPDH